MSMSKRITRGAILGIFLGVIFGVAISNLLKIGNILKVRNESYENVAIMVSSDEVNSEDASAWGPECHDLQDVVLRFHVKANSNSDEDLALKYSVRDAILYEYGEILQSDLDRQQVIDYLGGELDHIEEVARRTLNNLGYSYNVDVYISKDYFPIRQYGEMVFPAGYYDALRVDIGKAEGENFWCILYPMMCYTLDTGAVLSREDDELLRETLSEEDYDKLFVKRDTEKEDKVEVRFKFLELLGLY